MKKILLICGSPREGNTHYILSKIHESLKIDKKIVFLNKLNFSHCKGCLSCYETGECIINDDMKNLFFDLKSCDIFLIGSPLYYGNVSGLMKQFIDRTIPAYESKSLDKKRLISIMVGGGETKTTEKFHKESIKGFVKYNGLNLIGTYNFEAFEKEDLKKNTKAITKIDEIINKINSL